LSEQAIILVLLSAFLHASWNVFSKSSGDPISFLLRALAFSALLYAPLFVWMQFHVHYPPTVVSCLLGSGFFAGVYFFCLGKAYHHGRVSVAYPVARSFPILVVMFGGLFLREFPNMQGTAGVLLVVAGCFILPWERFALGPQGFCLANYRNRSVFWAMGAACCTSVYSLLDKVAAANMGDGTVLEKVNYVYLQNLIAWGAAVLCVRLAHYRTFPVARWRAFVCGAIFLVSYTLILLALATDPVAYVVSFRQLSIVLGTLVSMGWIERSFSWPRVVGVGMIFTGVVLVGLA
jgi:uncharacterized membrane protein